MMQTRLHRSFEDIQSEDDLSRWNVFEEPQRLHSAMFFGPFLQVEMDSLDTLHPIELFHGLNFFFMSDLVDDSSFAPFAANLNDRFAVNDLLSPAPKRLGGLQSRQSSKDVEPES